MNHGKREMPRNKKGLTALAALVLILCCAVGGTVAWLATSTGPVTNTFTPANVETEIQEDVSGGVKENVYIENKGDIPVYVRAAVIVNWVDNEGKICVETPEGAESQVTYDTAHWTKGSDGYYYYDQKVAANGSTAPDSLLTAKEVEAPEGCHLQVSILAEAIQAEGLGDDVTTAQQAFAKAKNS